MLRQEGIAVPVKSRASPKQRVPSDISDKQDEEELSSVCSDHPQEDGDSEDTLASGQLPPAPLKQQDSHSQGMYRYVYITT